MLLDFFSTFKEACRLQALVGDHNEWFLLFDEFWENGSFEII
jgi:hypothetical protein